MQNYMEESVTGVQRRRVYEFHGTNPPEEMIVAGKAAMPSLVLAQHDFIPLSNGKFVQDSAPSMVLKFNPENPKHLAIYASIEAAYQEEIARLEALAANPAPVPSGMP